MLRPGKSVDLGGGYNLVRITNGPTITKLGPSDFSDEEKINVNFETDVNLITLNQQILNRFNERKLKCTLLNETFNDLKLQISCSSGSSSSILSRIEKQSIDIEHKIKIYSSTDYIDSYVNHTKDILTEYNILGPKVQIVAFGDESPTNLLMEPERIAIIQKFLDIADIMFL